MGNQTSIAKSINDTVNKSLTDVLMTNSSTCAQNNISDQVFSIKNVNIKGCKFNIKGTQSSTQIPNLSCITSSDMSSKIMSEFKTNLKAAADSQTSGIGGALNSSSNSEVNTKLVNDITSKINFSNVTTCVQNNITSQQKIIDNIQNSCPAPCNNPTFQQGFDYNKNCEITYEGDQSIVQAGVNKCLSDNKTLADSINKAASTIEQISTSKNTGIDLAQIISSFFNGLNTPFLLSITGIVLIVLIICCSLIIIGLSGAGQEATKKIVDKGIQKF